MCKHICAAAFVIAALLPPGFVTQLRAAEQVGAASLVFPHERLSFPESSADGPMVIAIPVAPRQAAVALPSPQFTGIGAVVAMAVLLRCRKSILRLVG